MTSQPDSQTLAIHKLTNILRSQGNETWSVNRYNM